MEKHEVLSGSYYLLIYNETEESYANLLRKISHVFSMEQKLTCGNHLDEEIVLDQIGWNNFRCPKCGSGYTIGRKIIMLDPKPDQRSKGLLETYCN